MAKTNHSNVYLVRHTALDTLRVAKVIRKADMDSDTILREARLIMILNRILEKIIVVSALLKNIYLVNL